MPMEQGRGGQWRCAAQDLIPPGAHPPDVLGLLPPGLKPDKAHLYKMPGSISGIQQWRDDYR